MNGLAIFFLGILYLSLIARNNHLLLIASVNVTRAPVSHHFLVVLTDILQLA